jgi:hypothetical protein
MPLPRNKINVTAIEISQTNNKLPSDALDESVYDLIPVHISAQEKQAMYKSKYSDQANAVLFKGKKPMATMGPLHVPLDEPAGFLKKGHGVKKAVPTLPNVAKVKKFDWDFKTNFKLKKRDHSTRDYIKMNALENIHSIPKKTAVEKTTYLEKKEYGQVPVYLSKIIAEQENIKREKFQQESERELLELKQSQLERGIVPLPESERLLILEGLKKNWESLNGDYQKLSLTVDTVPKILRKVSMEKQLKQLEEQMAKFAHTNILVNFNSM